MKRAAVVPFAVDVAPKRLVMLTSTAIRVNAQQPPCGKCTAAAMGSTLSRLLPGSLCSTITLLPSRAHRHRISMFIADGYGSMRS
jgi:hypothetical protein